MLKTLCTVCDKNECLSILLRPSEQNVYNLCCQKVSLSLSCSCVSHFASAVTSQTSQPLW